MDFAMNLSLTTLHSPRGGANDFQLQYTWYTLPWTLISTLPPLLHVRDTLHFYLDDRHHELNDTTMDLTFDGGSPFSSNLVFPLSGTYREWGGGKGAGWFWPGEGAFEIAREGLEIVFTVKVSTVIEGIAMQYFVDPEMNIEGPTGPHPGGKDDKPPKRRRKPRVQKPY